MYKKLNTGGAVPLLCSFWLKQGKFICKAPVRGNSKCFFKAKKCIQTTLSSPCFYNKTKKIQKKAECAGAYKLQSDRLSKDPPLPS